MQISKGGFSKAFKTRSQSGAVLFVGLIMLTIVSLLAVSSMQSSNLQELMSSNMQDQTTAFEAAEAALLAAEEVLNNLQLGDETISLNDFDDDASDGLIRYMYDDLAQNADFNWDTDSQTTPALAGVASDARYVIQYIGPILDIDRVNIDNSYNSESTNTIAQHFRVTARGTGASDSSVVILESVFGVPNF